MYNHSIFHLFSFCVLWMALITQGQKVPFNKDWKFNLSDNRQAIESDFNDLAWDAVDLPHDWAFEAVYSEDAVQGDRGGYKPGGIAWYRKEFDLPKISSTKRVRIDFDAVYMNSEVWINGHYLGKRPYGYISFSYDLSKYLKPRHNVIAVRVDNSHEPSARWYHGCGIYGHVNLVYTDAVHIAKDGVWVATPQITKQQADVVVESEVLNTSSNAVTAEVKAVVLDPNGKKVAEKSQLVKIAAHNKMIQKQSFLLSQPQLWDITAPNLYKVVTTISVDNKVSDKVVTRFGIRTIKWDVKTGFWLNGKNIKLLGVSDHLEAGPVGAAIPDELKRWKIQLLKDMGCNAIRLAHNPETPVFYDLCDEIGILVMDEIFDGWEEKAQQDYGKQAFNDWWERDLRSWLKRDRNHPSVFIWSLGNETKGEVAKDLVRICREMDPYRLTTSGHSGDEEMDVLGVNGASESMKFFEQLPPNKPFVSTEAPHTWQVRGFYRTKTWFRDGYPNERHKPFPCPDLTEKEIFTYYGIKPHDRENRKQFFNSSYDNAMVRVTARKNWELMRDTPWYSGHFRWTGFDYIGEAGYVHGGWPFRAFMGGALDLAGFKKDLYYFYQSQWTQEPMVHILPHWTHPKMELGTEIPVWVYSNCDEVELFLNGISLGKDKPGRKWDEMQCEWMVPWEPGTITAVAYKEGKEILRTSHSTAGVPSQLKLSTTGDECPVVTVEQLDKKGELNPYAENRIHYYVEGPARLLSLESGNPINTESNYGKTSRTTFFGRGRAFLKKTSEKGDINVVVAAICGEKQLMTSNEISIDNKLLTLQGEKKDFDVKIYYSIDGTKPKTLYTKPFLVEQDTTVRAYVYDGQRLLFSMSEKFSDDEGLYWGSVEDSLVVGGGEQAEDAEFNGVKVSTRGNWFNGKGYIDFGKSIGGYVEWYQENDGDAGDVNLAIRYRHAVKDQEGGYLKLTVNGEVIKAKVFFPVTRHGTNYAKSWVKIPLKKGANTIRLTSIENRSPYIDEIVVK